MTLRRRQVLELAGGSLAALALEAGRRLAPAAEAAHPLAGGLPPRGDLRIALISDLNAGYGSTSYVQQVHRGVQLLCELRPDLVLCAGDMVAGQKQGLAISQLDAMWAGFDRQVLLPLLAGAGAFAPAMGNHDASGLRGPGGYRFALDREAAERFWRPRQASLGLPLIEASAFPFRYSFRLGQVFVLVLDASCATLPADEWAWAEAQLAAPMARQATVRLVMGHLPPYAVSQGRDRPGEVLENPERLLALLQRQRVTLLLSGHQHAWYPSRAGGVNLLSLGAMGSGPRQRLHDSRPPVQTLTLLDLDVRQAELREITVELNGVSTLSPAGLPAVLQPTAGPRLPRRSGPIRLPPMP